jgi:hypothetical protein
MPVQSGNLGLVVGYCKLLLLLLHLVLHFERHRPLGLG